ncbi:TfuA-like protein [Kitasatospora sp. NPDC087314]|uniref:TfuA-like protein n=1 Tax=Kitasatospora sp. NPDC087314 TaxID=3364068 RepID=UPI00381C7A68
MTAFVFVGPTLAESDRPRDWDVVYLPPVEQGHIHALAQEKPTAIGIVDGRFHDVPAVWHKEILWALRAGIPVYGSASMGALRAAELAPFGMRGIGKVFEQYRDGTLEDDDEVTVAHAGREDGHVQLSDAMVNIRATLHGARAQGLIGESTCQRLLDLAKKTYYPQRSLRLDLAKGRAAGLPEHEIDALRAFVAEHSVDQKKCDALAMLDVMRSEHGALPKPAADFPLQHNAFVDRSHSNGLIHDGDGDFLQITAILNEVRLRPRRYLRLRRSALGAVVPHLGAPPADARARTAAALALFRATHHLTADAEWRSWLAEHAYTQNSFASLIEDEVLGRSYRPYGGALNMPLLRALRSDPAYPRTLRRTRAKKRFLEAHGLADPSSSGPSTDKEVLRWYFTGIGRPFPGDIHRYATSLDFLDGYEFLKTVREEFHFEAGSSSALSATPEAAAYEATGTDEDDLGHRISDAVWEAEWSAR